MNFKAAIFDMDGLLLDTERVAMNTFEQACKVLGFPFHSEIYLGIIGRNAAGIEEVIRSGYGDDLDYPKLNQEWQTRYREVVTKQAIPKKLGVESLLAWLKSNGYKIAVATSSKKEVAQIKLSLANIDHYFDAFATGCEVSNGKPDPEIFLLAAQRLGIEPHHCIAFEDSNNGTQAAVAAKMTTFQIPDLVEPTEEIRNMGHHIHSSLLDVLHLFQNK